MRGIFVKGRLRKRQSATITDTWFGLDIEVDLSDCPDHELVAAGRRRSLDSQLPHTPTTLHLDLVL
jgi:hypothetical protein